jgi:hypothetical protein
MKTCKLYRDLDGKPLGGGVVHGIEFDSGYKGIYSAYFDEKGKMIDAENTKTENKVASDSPLWKKLEVDASLLFKRCKKAGMDA